MTVIDGGLESFLHDRENIAHIAGSKFIFVDVDLLLMEILSPGTCIYNCQRCEMVSESSSYQEIHCEFCSIRSVPVYGCRK